MSHLLCEFGMRLEQAELGSRMNFDISMAQEELIDTLAMTPIHVGRTPKSLAQDGLTQR